MATKPTASDASWGTDTNFSAGPESGNAVKVAPSAGVKAQGWRPGDALGYVGAWFNFWMNQVYLWILYLSDLHNSADFLNKTYAWVAAHTWAASNGTRVLDVTQNSTGEAIRATANNANDTLEVVQNGAGRAIHATGAVRVDGDLIVASGDVQIDAANDYTFGSAKSVLKLLPLEGVSGSGWTVADSFTFSTANTSVATKKFVIPDGALLTQVRVGIKESTAASGSHVQFEVRKYTRDTAVSGPDLGGPNVLGSVLGSDAATAASNHDILTTGAIADTYDASEEYYVARVTSSDGATGNADEWKWLEITYSHDTLSV